MLLGWQINALFEDEESKDEESKNEERTQGGDMSAQEFEYIRYEVDKGRARITLNRPEKRNAHSIEMVEELRREMERMREE